MHQNADDLTPDEEYELPIDGLPLRLERYAPHGKARRSVLLLHGGNTNSRMYHEPNGGLLKFLVGSGCDVWTLDWRASASVLKKVMRRPLSLAQEVAERALYTLDRVAEHDIPQALRCMRDEGQVKGEIAVMGFCLGGGSLSMAVARGYLEPFNVDNIVLVTMGLFYEVPWNGWVKAEDFIIERMLPEAADPKRSKTTDYRGVNPATPGAWPKALAHAYKCWPEAWMPTGKEPMDELFRRLTFMYGEPYARSRLLPAFERGLDKDFFGPIHVGLYLHASQLVRRGYAARFDALDVIDRTRIQQGSKPVAGHDLDPTYFRNKRVTAIAGAEDRLWHRDSMDLMYEWLRNEAVDTTQPNQRLERERHRKHVVPHYGHLDLFWGETSEKDVYPLFRDALIQPALGRRLPVAASSPPPAPPRTPPPPPPSVPPPQGVFAGAEAPSALDGNG